MSLTSLAASFADAYSDAPRRAGNGPVAAADGIVPPLQGSAGAAGGSSVSDNLKALTDYIPSEILTVYLAGVTAIQNWTFDKGSAADEQYVWLRALFFGCLIGSPLWVAVGVIVGSKGPPKWQPFVWPMIAATLGFLAYSLAVPKSWLVDTWPNGGLLATILLIATTPVLHAGTLVYKKMFPPTNP